eukprot:3519305-Pleurochrysis_carterae.AAC.1
MDALGYGRKRWVRCRRGRGRLEGATYSHGFSGAEHGLPPSTASGARRRGVRRRGAAASCIVYKLSHTEDLCDIREISTALRRI